MRIRDRVLSYWFWDVSSLSTLAVSTVIFTEFNDPLVRLDPWASVMTSLPFYLLSISTGVFTSCIFTFTLPGSDQKAKQVAVMMLSALRSLIAFSLVSSDLPSVTVRMVMSILMWIDILFHAWVEPIRRGGFYDNR